MPWPPNVTVRATTQRDILENAYADASVVAIPLIRNQHASGCTVPNEAVSAGLPDLARRGAALPNLKLRGLMAIPEPEADFEAQRAPFARLRQLYEQLRADGLELDTLSMGMSADLRAAIVEGATIVRVGSAIFGARHYS